jgi:hypothetical protein
MYLNGVSGMKKHIAVLVGLLVFAGQAPARELDWGDRLTPHLVALIPSLFVLYHLYADKVKDVGTELPMDAPVCQRIRELQATGLPDAVMLGDITVLNTTQVPSPYAATSESDGKKYILVNKQLCEQIDERLYGDDVAKKVQVKNQSGLGVTDWEQFALCHEMGHLYYDHTTKMRRALVWEILGLIAVNNGLAYLVNKYFSGYSTEDRLKFLGPALEVSKLLGDNMVGFLSSQQHEYEADAFAVHCADKLGKREEWIAAAQDVLQVGQLKGWWGRLLFTLLLDQHHPHLSKRLEALEKA